MIRKILGLALPFLLAYGAQGRSCRTVGFTDTWRSPGLLDGSRKHSKRRRQGPFARSILPQNQHLSCNTAMKLATLLRGGTDEDGVIVPQNEQLQPDESTVEGSSSALQDMRKETVGAALAWGVVISLVLAFLGLQRSNNTDRLMQFGSIYALSLIGSSVGFYLFLYFISVGYALGIGLPILVTLLSYLRSREPSPSTILHASLVVVWSLRLSTFLLWREYKSWPALHVKIVRVNEEQDISWYQKWVCWMGYSFLYVCMLTPCWYRLEEPLVLNNGVLSPGTRLGIGLQVTGLLLASVADYQKSIFKARHRLEWCRSGLWRYSTHPNYAGEWLFWFGTWIAGGAARSWPEVIMSLLGLAFVTVVLHGAAQALETKQRTKYGADYANFRDETSMWGPKFWASTTDASINSTATTSVPLEGNETSQL